MISQITRFNGRGMMYQYRVETIRVGFESPHACGDCGACGPSLWVFWLGRALDRRLPRLL